MNIHDYLIDDSGCDWPRMLEHWRWRLPPRFKVWLVNRFGDLFLILPDETVHRLDIGDGVLSKVAENREEFYRKTDDVNIINDWFLIPLADDLVAAGKTLNPGQCYCYRILPVLGGGYDVDDFVIKDLAYLYAAFGPIHERIKDLPDGTKIEFEITD